MCNPSICYLAKLIVFHGENILRDNQNRNFTLELKEEIIYKGLIESLSISSATVEYGL